MDQSEQEAAYCIVARSCNGRAKGTEGGEHGGGGRERKDDSWKFEARITYALSRFAELPDVSRSFHVIDPSHHSGSIAIAHLLRPFFNRNSNNKAEFWDCPSKA